MHRNLQRQLAARSNLLSFSDELFLTPFLTPHKPPPNDRVHHMYLRTKATTVTAAAFFSARSDIIHVRSKNHTYIVKNFGSSESRFAADA